MRCIFLALLAMLYLCALASAAISVDFNSFSASFTPDKKLTLEFKCTGGISPYYFQFKGLPIAWKTNANTIIMQNFSTSFRQNWKFDIYVYDSSDNYLNQSLALDFMGNYIGLTPVSAAITGKISNIYNNINNPMLNNRQITSQITFNPINELASKISNMNNINSGFGVNVNSPIATDLISSAKAQKNPIRDSKAIQNNQPGDFFNNVNNVIPQDNQTLSKLLSARDSALKKMTQANADKASIEAKTNTSRVAVANCNQQASDMQKMQNSTIASISESQSNLNRTKSQLDNKSFRLQNQSKILLDLNNAKRENDNKLQGTSNTLIKLQMDWQNCNTGISTTTTNSSLSSLSQQNNIQNQISNLKNVSNVAVVQLNKTNYDLNNIRTKISALQEQLKNARAQQSNLFINKQKYINVNTQTNKQIGILEEQARNTQNKPNAVIIANDCRMYNASIASTQNSLNTIKNNDNQISVQISNQKQLVSNLNNSIVQLQKQNQQIQLQLNKLKQQNNLYINNPISCYQQIMQYSQNAAALQDMSVKYDSLSYQIGNLTKQIDDLNSKQLSASILNLSNVSASSPSKTSDAINISQNSINNIDGSNNNYLIQNNSNPMSVSSSANMISSTTTSLSSNTQLSIDQIINRVLKQRNQSQTNTNTDTTIAPKPESKFSSSSTVNTFSTNNQPSTSNQIISSTANLDTNVNFSSKFINKPIQTQNLISKIQDMPVAVSVTAASISSTNAQQLIDDKFKVSSNSGLQSVYVGDAKNTIKQLGFDISSTALTQNSYLYSIDSTSLLTITMKNSMNAILSVSSCANTSTYDSALIEEVGLGHILARNQQILYRLTILQCTKIVSTTTTNTLKPGTMIYFSGISVVALPNNILMNTHLIVSVPN